jgi:hypothetical protein
LADLERLPTFLRSSALHCGRLDKNLLTQLPPSGTSRFSLTPDPVRTYYVRMNITLSASKGLIDKARAIAARQGVSLNDLVRRQLEMITGAAEREDIGQRLVANMKKSVFYRHERLHLCGRWQRKT